MPRERSVSFLVPGVHAYAEKSIEAGRTIRFRVSSDAPYTLSVVRLGGDPDGPSLDRTLRTFRSSGAAQQPIAPGSYVSIDKALRARQALRALTLECWVRLWGGGRWQGLITQHTFPRACGFGLFITASNEVAFYVGDGGGFNSSGLKIGPTISPDRWYHLVGVWDRRAMSLWVDGHRARRWTHSGPVRPGSAPLRLAAYGEDGLTDHVLDGDLAMPVIYRRALRAVEIGRRFSQRALKEPSVDGVFGCWPLDEEEGDRVSDISPHRRHGRIINHATWMIGGPSFDADAVPRYGCYAPADDPKRGHALRFASDDLYDCGWRVTHRYRIRRRARPGIYVGRIHFGTGSIYDVTFIVRKHRRRPKAPILMLCSSSTWLAYNSTPFAPNHTDADPRRSWDTGGHGDLPGTPATPHFSCYVRHRAGQPTYHIGLRTPWPAAGPYILYGTLDTNYSHLARADRFAHLWLDRNGYDYDVITDFDLHHDADVLNDYKVLIINGHSEYWSIPAYEGVGRFLRCGGGVIVLSGNTMFWRVSFDRNLSVMQCRKLPTGSPGGQTDAVGEIYHSGDGRRGGLMRECGYPAVNLIGLESAGYASPSAADADIYTCEHPDHEFFNHPTTVGLGTGDTFGGAPSGGLPMAVGHEWDVRVSNPEQEAAFFEPPGIETLARCRKPTGTVTYWDYFMRPTGVAEPTVSEIIDWKRPMGGRVFYVGSIGAGWGLSTDPKLQTLMRNVLHHFGV